MAIAWNPTMSTGNALVDQQHRELFRQAALLSDAMSQGKGTAEVGKIIDFLEQYVVKHFAEEEKIMEKTHCPVAEENKKAHAEFLQKFKVMREQYVMSGANAASAIQLNRMICDWLVSHIQTIDTKLREPAAMAH